MIYPIPPNLWCVPSALVALTGLPWDSVIHPAINRHNPTYLRASPNTLSGLVTSTARTATLAVLDELGYTARRYRGENPHAQIRTWAARSAQKYPGRPLLVMTFDHALVIADGRVYDNHAPHGPSGAEHPFARTRVQDAYLVEKRR